MGLFGMLAACDNAGLADWSAAGAAGQPATANGSAGRGGTENASLGGSGGNAAGSGGSAGSDVGGSGGASAAGAGGSGPVECPEDDGTAAALTLAGLDDGLPEELPDAGVGDAGAGDAGDGGTGLDPEGFALPDLVGWASEPGLGTAATIGGAEGEIVTARTADELVDYAGRPEPLVIRVCGMLRVPDLRVSSHKTLLGVGKVAGVEGGVRIGSEGDAVHNVVLKNLRVDARLTAVNGDGVRVDGAHHVWLDHCELFDSSDTGAALDVVRGADFVSVSWTKFHFTASPPDPEHRFACRIGDHDNETESLALDTGHLKVTLHHNWFADNIRQRAPRVRLGDVHLFNNYYSVGEQVTDYSIWASTGSRVLLEQNYFHGVANPHELKTTDAHLLAIGNIYDGTTGLAQSDGTAFSPPYAYVLDSALGLPVQMPQGAGPR